MAITRYRKADDYKPYLLKTADYGATWSRIDGGFPQGEITRTIREDTVRKGLLFVGTETGVYVSIDDGEAWKRISLNMPTVPVHDIAERATLAAGDVLPLAFAVDDTALVEGVARLAVADEVVLLIRRRVSEEAQQVSLTILDADGEEIRTFTDEEIPTERFRGVDSRGYEIEETTGRPKAGVGKGLNRFVWDMRYPICAQVPGRPPANIKPIAKPGTYKVRLTVDGKSQEQSFELQINPNERYTRAQTDAKFDSWMKLHAKADQAVKAIQKGHAAKEKAAEAAAQDPALEAAAAKVAAVVDGFEASMLPTGLTLVQIISEPTKPLSLLTTLHNLQEHTEGPMNQPWFEVYGEIETMVDARMAEFEEELAEVMEAFE